MIDKSTPVQRSCTFLFHLLFLCIVSLSYKSTQAQTSGSITVGGDIGTFYPVAWLDGNFYGDKNTNLFLGRSRVHTDAQWRGSFIANFTFHTNNWGNGANVIDSKIVINEHPNSQIKFFIAGWQDATSSNSDRRIIIWLRGGGTTYYYSADANVDPKVYDGVQNALPYVSSNGSYTAQVKTAVDATVLSTGQNFQFPINVYAAGSNYLHGSLGIGKRNPTEKLEVNGTIRAKEIKVEATPWPDYVFEEDYQLPSLQETEQFIKINKHLPEVPSAKEVEGNGVALGEMNALLFKKVEELTLHLIDNYKTIRKQGEEIEQLKRDLSVLKLSH